MDFLPLIRRGALSGLAAGLVSGLFSLAVAEPTLDRAVRLETARVAGEQARARAAGGSVEYHADVFSRSTQHAGLVLAAVVTGIALGVLFAVVDGLVRRRREPGPASWGQSMRLAGAGFVGVWLLPFLRYPANPPGVGDPGTVDARTHAWLGAIAVSVLIVGGAWQLDQLLKDHRTGLALRQLAALGLIVAGLVGLIVVLPSNPDPIDVPATLLWNFRLLAVAAAALLWGCLGAGYAALGSKAHRPAPRPAPAKPATAEDRQRLLSGPHAR